MAVRRQVGFVVALEDLTSDVVLALLDSHAFEEALCRLWFEGREVRQQLRIRRIDGDWLDVQLDADTSADLGYSLADLRDAAREEAREPLRGIQLLFSAGGKVDVTLLRMVNATLQA